MSDLLQLMEVLAFIYLTLWVGFVLLRLISGAMRSAYVVLIVFYVLNGLPLLFDALLGRPYYSMFPGIERASNDPATRWVYVAFLVLVPPILLLASARKTLPDGSLSRLSLLMRSRIVTLLVWLVAMLPFVVWAVSPEPSAYRQYGTIHVRHRLLSGGVTEQQFNQFHILISSTALLSIASVAFLIYRHPQKSDIQRHATVRRHSVRRYLVEWQEERRRVRGLHGCGRSVVEGNCSGADLAPARRKCGLHPSAVLVVVSGRLSRHEHSRIGAAIRGQSY